MKNKSDRSILIKAVAISVCTAMLFTGCGKKEAEAGADTLASESILETGTDESLPEESVETTESTAESETAETEETVTAETAATEESVTAGKAETEETAADKPAESKETAQAETKTPESSAAPQTVKAEEPKTETPKTETPSSGNTRPEEPKPEEPRQEETPAAGNNTPAQDTGSGTGSDTPASEPAAEQKEETPASTEHVHNMTTVWRNMPTCTSTGYKNVKCSECGWIDESQSGDVPMLPHTPVGRVIVEGDCVSPSVTRYQCSVCGLDQCQDDTKSEGPGRPDVHEWTTEEVEEFNEETFEITYRTVTYCGLCGATK